MNQECVHVKVGSLLERLPQVTNVIPKGRKLDDAVEVVAVEGSIDWACYVESQYCIESGYSVAGSGQKLPECIGRWLFPGLRWRQLGYRR